MKAVMNFFSSRMRKTDDMAMVLAFEPPERRLDFALATIRTGARSDNKNPKVLIAKVLPEDVARVALVKKEQAQSYLEGLEAKGKIKLGRRCIQFPASESKDSSRNTLTGMDN